MVEAMEIQKGFKRTDIGLIPNDWDTFYITQVIETTNGIKIGPFGSQLKKELLTSSGYKVYGQENVYEKDMELGNRYISKEHFKKLSSCELKEGDFIISMMGTIGKCMMVPCKYEAGIMDSHLIRIRLNKSKIDSELLLHYFSSSILTNQVNKLSVGGIMDGLSSKIVKNISVPLPPTKAEQTAIAEALNDADALIAELEKLIAKKKAIKQGAMQELLKPKAGCEVRLLGDFLDYEQPTKYVVADTEYNDHNQTPVLTAGKTFILGYTNEEFGVFNNHPVIIFDDFTTATKYIDFPFKVKSSAMKILKPKKDVNLRFVFELMQTIKFDSTDHKRYWISEYRNIEVKVPRPDEQDHISKILSDMDAEIEVLEKKLDKYKMLKQGLMQNLLTGKIRLI